MCMTIAGCHWKAHSGTPYRSLRRAQHKLAARLEELKPHMNPGGEALVGIGAVGKETYPGEPVEAFLTVGEEVNVLVATPVVNSIDKERYLYLQLLLIGCALEPTTLLLGSACHMSPSSGETAVHNHLYACLHLCATPCIPSVQLSGVAGFLMHEEAAQTSPASVNEHGINIVRHRLRCHQHVFQKPMP